MKLDSTLETVLKDLYTQLRDNSEITVESPQYRQTQIDVLVSCGLVKKIDVSTLDGWAYIIQPTYEGENYFQINQSPLLRKVNEFIQRGEEIKSKEFHSGSGGFPGYFSGPLYDAWMNEIKIFNERHLKDHPLYESISSTIFHNKRQLRSFNDMMGHLHALESDDEYWGTDMSQLGLNMGENKVMSKKVFIVHGHDEAALHEMARTLSNGGFEPIILHEQPDAGLTIIEKIERYSDVDFAVVLYTECDVGREKQASIEAQKYRARQNVVFEHGYLICKLKRNHVCALVKGDVETPGDISGVVYVKMDEAGAWKMQLAKNMSAAGLPVDLNEFCR